MANYFVRLYHDMPNDPKWRTIARLSGQSISVVQAVYLQLLVDASRNVTRGHVTVTVEDIASALGETEASIEAVIDAMESRVVTGSKLTGWDKRNPETEDAGDPVTGAKSATQRKREQRERQRLVESGNRDITNGHDESRNVTTDIDKKEIKKEHKDRFTLPDWIDPSLWKSFEEMRQRLRKPMTDDSRKLAVKKLESLRSLGHTPQSVIENSVMNSYQGLFPPSESKNSPAVMPKRVYVEAS